MAPASDSGLTPFDEELLRLIERAADADGRVVSLFDVAVRQAGFSYSYAHARLKVLEAFGLVEVERPEQGRALIIRRTALSLADCLHKRFTLRFSPTDTVRLERVAERLGLSKAQLVIELLQLVDASIGTAGAGHPSRLPSVRALTAVRIADLLTDGPSR